MAPRNRKKSRATAVAVVAPAAAKNPVGSWVGQHPYMTGFVALGGVTAIILGWRYLQSSGYAAGSTSGGSTPPGTTKPPTFVGAPPPPGGVTAVGAPPAAVQWNPGDPDALIVKPGQAFGFSFPSPAQVWSTAAPAGTSTVPLAVVGNGVISSVGVTGQYPHFGSVNFVAVSPGRANVFIYKTDQGGTPLLWATVSVTVSA